MGDVSRPPGCDAQLVVCCGNGDDILAATITTLPTLLVTFLQIALLSLPVNALARSVPAQPGVMLFGGAALLAGMVFPPLGQIAGWAR